MELDLEINVGNNKTNEIEEFTKELNKVLQEDKILAYQGYDGRKFTNVNEERIWNKREELIGGYINQNNINGADENKLYEITGDVAGGVGILEYNRTYDNRTYLTVNTSNGKIEESNSINKTIENVMGEFTKYAIEKLAEFIKESINKFKSK